MSTLNIRPLNSELQLIASEHLNENTEQIQQFLTILRQWLEKSIHLKVKADDQFLIAFLRGCKFSVERTKEKIDMYCTYRTQIPEIMGERDPLNDTILEVIKRGISLPLPILESPESPRIILFRLGTYDPKQIRIESVMKVYIMINDILMNEDDNTVVTGQMCVCDLAGLSMGHIIQMQPAFLKKAIMIWQDSSPIRTKGVHYINAPKSFEQMFNFFKTLLNEKMRARFFMHSSLDTFYSVIPRKMMPTEYDGEAGNIQSLVDVWEKKILSYRDYFLDETQFGVDESKRIVPSRNTLFGIEGSFRQLQFD